MKLFIPNDIIVDYTMTKLDWVFLTMSATTCVAIFTYVLYLALKEKEPT